MRVAAAYLGALPVTETNCVTKPFQPENCPNCHPTKICGLHSSEAIEAIVRCKKTQKCKKCKRKMKQITRFYKIEKKWKRKYLRFVS